jgi:hypothetical protein
MDGQSLAAFITGVVFVSLMLIIACLIAFRRQREEIPSLAIWIFRVILALSGAAFAAVLTGFLGVEGTLNKWTFRAGGPLAVFLLLYRVNPPNLVQRSSSRPRQDLEEDQGYPALSAQPADSNPSGLATEPGERIIDTPRVGFTSEREPRLIDLQRAVHFIVDQLDAGKSFRIPLEYDPRIVLLQSKLKHLYDNYEHLIKPSGHQSFSLSAYDEIRDLLVDAPKRLGNLPSQVAMAVVGLRTSDFGWSSAQVVKTCANFLELTLTDLISHLSRWQINGPDVVLGEYAGMRDREEYVALTAQASVQDLVSYRIVLQGDYKELEVWAPVDYGNARLLVLRESVRKGPDYVPPISFLTDYLFPQQFSWRAPSDWTISQKCESVFVKDGQEDYLS